jgi:hypothetical protein
MLLLISSALATVVRVAVGSRVSDWYSTDALRIGRSMRTKSGCAVELPL